MLNRLVRSDQPREGILEAGATSQGSVPYAYAKANGVIVIALSNKSAEVVVRTGAHARALAEVRRRLGVPVYARQVDFVEFERLLSKLKTDGAYL